MSDTSTLDLNGSEFSTINARDLFGPDSIYIDVVERAFNVAIMINGICTIQGQYHREARKCIKRLLNHLAIDGILTEDVVRDTTSEVVASLIKDYKPVSVTAYKKTVTSRNYSQALYLDTMMAAPITFGVGPAGTGKTKLAVHKALGALDAGLVTRIVITRPAVASEDLGYLPGDEKEKIDPYLRPVYDEIDGIVGFEQREKMIEQGFIEVSALSFLRGRTLKGAFIIIDEAQNATFTQLKMGMTRLGEGSFMVITGAPDQVDLRPGTPSGLVPMLECLAEAKLIKICTFAKSDQVRHPVVEEVLTLTEDKE